MFFCCSVFFSKAKTSTLCCSFCKILLTVVVYVSSVKVFIYRVMWQKLLEPDLLPWSSGLLGNVRSCDDSSEVTQHTHKNAPTHGHKRRLYASHCMLFVSRHELLSRELTRDLLRVDPAGSPENILMSNRCRVFRSHKRSTVANMTRPLQRASDPFGPTRKTHPRKTRLICASMKSSRSFIIKRCCCAFRNSWWRKSPRSS